MAAYELAQLNIALLKAPLESPLLADFVANLERINALAEAAPGFLWRLETEAGDATAIRPFGDDFIVNLSVWANLESLHGYVYGSDHARIMSRRREWFDPMQGAHLVLWWVPPGHRPTIEEAAGRLEALRTHGPHAEAFTFRKAFAPPDPRFHGSGRGFPDPSSWS
jgi:hypothetical protein